MSIVTGEAAKKIQEQLKIEPSEATERGKQKLYEMFSEKESIYQRSNPHIAKTGGKIK
jgi:hypothetical protein